jgi:hypothetical protein
MTDAEEKQLLMDVAQVKREIHTLTERIVGNPFALPDPIIGILDVQKAHTADLYGDPKTQHEGVKPKLEKLVEDNNRTRYTVLGIISVAAAFVTLYACWDVIATLFK